MVYIHPAARCAIEGRTASLLQECVVGEKAGTGEACIECSGSVAIVHEDSGFGISIRTDPSNWGVIDGDAEGVENAALCIVEKKPIGEESELVCPLGQQFGDVDRERRVRAPNKRDLLASDLVSVAIRTMEHSRSPKFPQARNIRESVG